MKSNKGQHTKHSRKIYKIFLCFFVIVILLCLCIFIYNLITLRKNKKNYEEIATDSINITDNENKVTENVKKVLELKRINSDVVGWIRIDNTIIDYPLLQTTDNNYYLTYNYKKEKSKYGSIFINKDSNIEDIYSNVIIYGHNMNDEQMFNTLLDYEDKNFYNEHKKISIATDKEEAEYEIVSVFKSRIFYQDEKNKFRYYKYTSFENKELYNSYIENCKKIQLYDTGISAEYGEQLITLITCEYSQENGRMVIVAKKINN